MPQDHYVPQVHLKNFYSPALKCQMYGIRKSDMHLYPCDAKSQCRDMDGSTNLYLSEPRLVEEFLDLVEPIYNSSVEKLRSRQLDSAAIFSIAGFAAYVSSCSPAAMRLNSEPLKHTVNETMKFLERMGKIPPPPEVLGASSMKKLLKTGKVVIEIDAKYPQAMGIQSIIHQTSIWGNSRWDVILNDDPSTPFFTSDFPVAIEPSQHDQRLLNRIVPLTPDIAIRILPDIRRRDEALDHEFSNLRVRYVVASKQEVIRLNTTIVQCAESTVYFRDKHPWVLPFVKKHKSYRVESVTQTIPQGKGKPSIPTMQIGKTG